MKPPKATTWPTLDKLPPSIVFQTVAFLGEDDGDTKRRGMLRNLVESVETVAKINMRDFVAPSQPPTTATADRVQRIVAGYAAFISLLEDGALECELQKVGMADLLRRFMAARDVAIARAKDTRAILVAALANAIGALRQETTEQRLERSIHMAREESPVYLGSFAEFADEVDDAD
jgi:hypothetical protein